MEQLGRAESYESNLSEAERTEAVDLRVPLQVPVLLAASLLSVSKMTLYRMRERKEIVFKRWNGRTMVATSELLRVHKLMTGMEGAELVRDLIRDLKKTRPKKRKLIQQVN